MKKMISYECFIFLNTEFGLFYGRIIGNGVYVLNWVNSSVLNISGVFTFFGCVFIFCVGFFMRAGGAGCMISELNFLVT